MRSRRFCSGHVFLGQFHLHGAALLLEFVQGAALFAQGLVRAARFPPPRPSSCTSKPRATCALTCSRSCCSPSIFCARFVDFRLGLGRCARRKDWISRAALLGQIGNSAMRCFQRLFLAGEGSAQLLLGGQRHFGFRQRGVGRLALLAQISSEAVNSGERGLRTRARALPARRPGAASSCRLRAPSSSCAARLPIS